jgi:hypothetical protein
MMKNIIKYLGVFVLIAAIGFSMATCGDGDDDGNDVGNDVGNPAHFGETLNLTGQVYTEVYSDTGMTYQIFSNNRTIQSRGLGGGGAINSGQLNFTIGVPDSFILNNIENVFMDIEDGWVDYDNFNISAPQARGAFLTLGTGGRDFLGKENRIYSATATTESSDWSYVLYFYVDRDVTISASRTEYPWTEDGKTYNNTYNAFNITLKRGWNAFLRRNVSSQTLSGGNTTISYAISNPNNLRWVFKEY